MLAKLLFLALSATAAADEMDVIFESPVTIEGYAEVSLTPGDFDGDGLTDIAIPVGGGSAFQITMSSRTQETWFLLNWESDDVQPVSAVDWDGDGDDELIFGMPLYRDKGGTINLGAVFVMDPSELAEGIPAGKTQWAEDLAVFAVYGEAGNGLLGSGLAATDLDGDGLPELIVGDPRGDFGAGGIYVFANGTGSLTTADAAGRWSSDSALTPGLGAAITTVADLDGDGFEDIIAATCDLMNPDGVCETTPKLLVLSSEEALVTGLADGLSAISMSNAPLLRPRWLTTLPDLSNDGADEVIWNSTGYHQLLYPVLGTPSEPLLTITTTGEGGAAWLDDVTGDTLPDLLVHSGDQAVVLDDFSASELDADTDGVDAWFVTGLSAGGVMRTADLNNDGCQDVLSTARRPGPDDRNDDTLYAVYTDPCEADVGDTGDTADTGPVVDTGPTVDTGDTADTAPPEDTAPVDDTGPTDDTGPGVDTGPGADTAQDTGSAFAGVCREYGWSCGGGGGGAAFLLLALVGFRRRRSRGEPSVAPAASGYTRI